MIGPRNLRQRQRLWQKKMSTKTTTTTIEASSKNRRRVQGIVDDDRGGSRSKTGPVDWQRKQSVDFTCYWVANINTVLSLSIHCLVLIFFSQE